jgi:hypothetical protein
MTTKTPSQRIALLEAKWRARPANANNEHGGSSKWAQCWNHSANEVAALTAEQRKYFISRVLANWKLMGTKGNNQHQGDA